MKSREQVGQSGNGLVGVGVRVDRVERGERDMETGDDDVDGVDEGRPKAEIVLASPRRPRPRGLRSSSVELVWQACF